MRSHPARPGALLCQRKAAQSQALTDSLRPHKQAAPPEGTPRFGQHRRTAALSRQPALERPDVTKQTGTGAKQLELSTQLWRQVAVPCHTEGSLPVRAERSRTQRYAAGGPHLVDTLGAQDLHQRVAARAARVRAAVRVRLAVALLMDAVLQLDVRAVAEGRVLRRNGPAADRPASVHVRLPATRRG